MSEVTYSNDKIAAAYPQSNKEETPMLSSQKTEICPSKEDIYNTIERESTSPSQGADISPRKQAYFFPSHEEPEVDISANVVINLRTGKQDYISPSKDALPDDIENVDKLGLRKISSKYLNIGFYAVLIAALATCLVSIALTFYVSVKCAHDVKTLPEPVGALERKFSHPVCVQCIKLVQNPFDQLQADPLVDKLVKQIDDGFQMCCAENADQMSAMVEAITREQVTKPIPGLDNKNNSKTGLKYVSVSAHKQLLAGDDREDNVTEPYYGNGSEHFVVKLNKDYNDPLTEHSHGVTVMDTALEVRHSGVYYVYFSVNLAPRPDASLHNSAESWSQYVHRTRPNSPANSGLLLGTSHTSSSHGRNHQETVFAGGTFALKKGDLIQVCINGLGLVQFRKESSFLGIILLSNAATEK